PLDPAGVERRTLGGLAATDASGPLRARYGTMRDLLLGVRFVQADGVMTWGGAKVVKSVSGYDVPKLLVGALGTLGVLGALTLRPLGASFWAAHAEATALDGAIVLSVGTLVTLVGETAAETERAVAAAGGAATLTGAATLGSLRAAFPAVEPRAVRTLVERLRAFVAPVGGGVIIQRAPAAVRAA